MSVSKAEMGGKNPVEYAEGARKARKARAHAAAQLAHLIESADLTGSHDFVARRIKDYATAIREGDSAVVRAALMDLGAACGATIASIDLGAPSEGTI